MGNGADKILDVLDAHGITVSDFFASDGFVRGHSFHGKRVLSFSEIKEKYEKY
jgi:peptidoglycan/xylan/chitin deacetylase (PgdA/CDA1 family)